MTNGWINRPELRRAAGFLSRMSNRENVRIDILKELADIRYTYAGFQDPAYYISEVGI